jgi:hypothetical protein
VEDDLRKMEVKRWRKKAIDRTKWRKICGAAKVLQELYIIKPHRLPCSFSQPPVSREHHVLSPSSSLTSGARPLQGNVSNISSSFSRRDTHSHHAGVRSPLRYTRAPCVKVTPPHLHCSPVTLSETRVLLH